MTTITPQAIRELRERTGIGVGKCKEALTKSGGDIELAISNLRKAGAASAVKKEGRVTNEGLIAFAENGNGIAVVEVNAETDFVVKNDRFVEFLKTISEEVLNSKSTDLDAFLKLPYSKDSALTIDQLRATIVQAIGENVKIRRIKFFPKKGDSSFGVYSHHSGKIVSVVEVAGSGDQEAFAREIAMHTAAAAPEYLTPDDVPQEVLSREREISKEQVKGKPENIMEKILEGKARAFCDQNCLIKQKFVKDDSVSIEDLVKKQTKESGKPLNVSTFIRWSLGDKLA